MVFVLSLGWSQPGKRRFLRNANLIRDRATSMGRTLTLSVSATDSVEDVKAAIEAKNRTPCNLQRMVFGGKQLSGDSLLVDHNVTRSSCLDLRPCHSAVSQQPKLFVKTLFGKTLVFDVDVTEETVDGLKARKEFL